MGKIKELISKYESNSIYLFTIGMISAVFFTVTFLINSAISIDGGHWYWSGSLRFIIMLILLSILLLILKGINFYIEILKDYKKNFIFWNISGTLGFGVFYSLICFAADFSPAWVVATTWQLSIISSLFVLTLYGRKLSKKIWFFTFFIFFGVCLVNFQSFDMEVFKTTLIGFIAVIVAGFAYPLGNQMVWEEKSKRHQKQDFKMDVLDNAFAKVFLMTLGSLPLWIGLFIFLGIDFLPTKAQIINVSIIALLSGVVATTLFMYARSKADTSKKIMLVDSTLAGEVVIALFAEILFLGLPIPSISAFVGIVIIMVGLIAILKIDK